MSLWINDLRMAVRKLVRQPGFTLSAVALLALGLGANTTLLNTANLLLLRPPSLDHPSEIVRVFGRGQSSGDLETLSYPHYQELASAHSLQGLAAHRSVTATLSLGEGASEVGGELVSGNYFDLLGVTVQAGRTLQSRDDQTIGQHPVAVVSDAFWRTQMGADGTAIGRQIYLNGHAFEIVGIASPAFRGSYETFPTSFWVPVKMYQQVRGVQIPLDRREWGWLNTTGRLAPGVSREQAQAEISTIASRIAEADGFPGQYDAAVIPASSAPESMLDPIARALTLLIAVGLLVLATTAANIAGVQVTRAMGRRQETAIRLSLGATAWQTLRAWLIEGLLLAALAVPVAFAVGFLLHQGLVRSLPPVDFLSGFRLSWITDWRTMGAVLGLASLSGLTLGLVPGFQVVRRRVAGTLQETNAQVAGHRTGLRWQKVLVVAQISVCVMVLVSSTLLVRSLLAVEALEPGFETDNHIVASFPLRRMGYEAPQARDFFERLEAELAGLPGVTSVARAASVPLGGDSDSMGFQIEGHTPPDGRSRFSIAVNAVGPNYFSTLGIPLLAGREFESRDQLNTTIINETMATRFWPGQSAVGQAIWDGDTRISIIGVVSDIQYYRLGEDPRPFAYFPIAGNDLVGSTLHIRTVSEPTSVLNELKHRVSAINPLLAVDATTFDELRRIPLFPQWALATLSVAAGLLTLLLATSGVYVLVSFAVASRFSEFGIRLALGSTPGGVMRLALRHGLRFTLVGVGIGLVGSLGLAHLVSSFLFETSSTDPSVFVMTAAFFFTVALLASYLPARKAASIDPLDALRHT